MDNAFQTVTIAVTSVGIAVSATKFFWPASALRDLGRIGQSWFSHAEDQSPEELPDGNANDAPIPRRPLRPRGY
jgi:hypothetical protein